MTDSRERLDALLRILTDSGDITPMGVRQIGRVLDAGSPKPAPRRLAVVDLDVLYDLIDSGSAADWDTWRSANEAAPDVLAIVDREAFDWRIGRVSLPETDVLIDRIRVALEETVDR